MDPSSVVPARQMYLTVKDLACMWKISPTFIRRAIWRGELKVKRFGKALRIHHSDARQFAQSTEGPM